MLRRLCVLLSAAAVALCLPASLQARDTKPAKTNEKSTKAGKVVIPVFRLRGELKETPGEENLSLFSTATPETLHDIVDRMNKAAEDANVKAVVLLAEGGGPNRAQTEEMLQALAHLRHAGKKIYAFADQVSMREYVLLAGADRISVVPTADLWVTGLYGESMYLRGLLDKLSIKPDFLHEGAYKSASETFMRTGPSPEAEKMQNWLLDSMYQTSIDLIAKGRHVSPDQVQHWIDNGPYTAEKAKAAGLIDAVEQMQEFEKTLKKDYGQRVVFDKKYAKKKPPQLDFSSPFAVFKLWAEMLSQGKQKSTGKPSVGIVYLDGAIELGGSVPSVFGAAGASSTALRKALTEAADDDSIKAVVLRIDSPGGSAVASEIIYDAGRRLRAKKPFVVSMGGVAASGGYYSAMAADTIYADASTITGSIGVVGGKLATEGLYNKFGVTFKAYQRGKNAGILAADHPFTKEERERMQAWMHDIYGVFKGHVMSSRGKRLAKPIDQLAGGRVYTGKQALELGLIDKIGTLQDAIRHAAKEAKVTNYEVRVVPRPKNFIEKLMEESQDDDSGPSHSLMDTRARHFFHLPTAALVDLALPYLQHLDSQHVRTIEHALRRLQLLQQEGVILMAPELPR